MEHQEFTKNGNTIKVEAMKIGLMDMHCLYIKCGGKFVDAAAASNYYVIHESRSFAECERIARKIDSSSRGITICG